MMKDDRVRVKTEKAINLSALDEELGGFGLCATDGEVVAVAGSPVTEEQLSKAIDAHTPSYPEQDAREAAIAHAKSLGFTDAMIAVMYPNLGGNNE